MWRLLIICAILSGCSTLTPEQEVARTYQVTDEYNMCRTEFVRRGLTWKILGKGTRRHTKPLSRITMIQEMHINGCKVFYDN
jgi:hypothetical protein